MADTSKAEPTNTTILKVMSDSKDECAELLSRADDRELNELHTLVVRWYLKGISAGQRSAGSEG